MPLQVLILITVFISGCLGGLLNSILNNPNYRPESQFPEDKNDMNKEYNKWLISILYKRSP